VAGLFSTGSGQTLPIIGTCTEQLLDYPCILQIPSTALTFPVQLDKEREATQTLACSVSKLQPRVDRTFPNAVDKTQQKGN